MISTFFDIWFFEEADFPFFSTYCLNEANYFQSFVSFFLHFCIFSSKHHYNYDMLRWCSTSWGKERFFQFLWFRSNKKDCALLVLLVVKILEGSLDLILSPSPSVKIQIYGRESLLEVIRQNIAVHCQQTLKKKFVDITQQCFALLPKGKLSCQ